MKNVNNTTTTIFNAAITAGAEFPADMRGVKKYNGFYAMCKTHIVEEFVYMYTNRREYDKLAEFLGFDDTLEFEDEAGIQYEDMLCKWFTYVTGSCYEITVKELNEKQLEFEAESGEILEEYFTEYY